MRAPLRCRRWNRAPVAGRGGVGPWALAGLWLLGCAGARLPAVERPPNIVLLVADDQAFTDFGFMGSPLARTPNLDALAAEGTVFPLGFSTASICKPALLSLLTGLHPIQFRARQRAIERRLEPRARYPDRVRARARQQLVRALPSLPRLLARHGYASFQAGKYWEGHFSTLGFTHGVGTMREGARVGREPMDPVFRFVLDHREQPFFLWFAPMLPHLPFDASREERAPYVRAGLSAESQGYYANVSRLDARVGELLRLLDRAGLRDRTVVVFLSDNGWQMQGFNSFGRFWDGPRGKYSLYELGLRTPIVFRWPGRIPAGRWRDGLVSTVDVVTTLLAYAGVAPPDALAGRDLRAAIEGREEVGRDFVVASMEQIRATAPIDPETGEPVGPARGGALLRTRRWAYIAYDARPHELYDMVEDPGQQRDVASRHPELTKGFREQVRVWKREMAGPREGEIGGAREGLSDARRLAGPALQPGAQLAHRSQPALARIRRQDARLEPAALDRRARGGGDRGRWRPRGQPTGAGESASARRMRSHAPR